MSIIIDAQNLCKEFRVARQRSGRFSGLRSLLAREYNTKVAIRDLSLQIAAGELVGYIGPNGAGKSTTIKMLTGILVPTAGHLQVRGLVPYRQRVQYARQIGVVFGQRTQLWWDLPTIESLELLRYMYGMGEAAYRRNLARLTELLELGPFLPTPVRQLSLGQRMRADLAAALLHDPAILYLDEPTVGLDVVAKQRIREFIREINRERGVTVILTTHDMQDVEKLCNRTILIDGGSLVYDGPLAALRERYGTHRTLVIDLEGEGAPPPEVQGAVRIRSEGNRHWLRFDRRDVTASELIARVNAQCSVRDLTVEEPETEAIIRRIYQEGRAAL